MFGKPYNQSPESKKKEWLVTLCWTAVMIPVVVAIHKWPPMADMQLDWLPYVMLFVGTLLSASVIDCPKKRSNVQAVCGLWGLGIVVEIARIFM